ncbi:MAG TPA: YjbE family putative metal transport protein [Acidisphaera sp.]|nr:YjbE family putative metal transport protein [Acidisphaera sp.]
MSFAGLPDFLGKPLGVVLIDLLLAGDNAVVIALVCLSLPPRSLRWVLVFGTAGAVVLRVALAGIVGGMLDVPGLKLVGGALLSVLAVNLVRAERKPVKGLSREAERGGVIAASVVVVLVDVLMSLDNVVAVAAVAGDSVLYLALGLSVSIAILMFASAFVARLLQREPELARLGAALLGWVAASMMVSDSLIAGWVGVQSPALPVVLPILAAVYVYALGGGVPQQAVEAHPVAPARRKVARPRPAPARVARPPVAATFETASAGGRELWLFAALFALAGIVITIVVVLGGAVAH